MGTAEKAVNGRVFRGNLAVSDGLLVVLVTALALGLLVYRTLEGPEISAGGIRLDVGNTFAAALLLAAMISLIWHRRASVPVLVVSGAAFLLSDLIGSATPLLAFAPLMALYAVAVNNALSVSALGAAALAVGALTTAVANPGPLDDDFLDYLLSVGTAWLLGYGVRLNRARTSLLAEQAAQLTREHAAKTQAAVRQEQTRIARELHDIVAHCVVVMVAQAGASTRMFDTDPQRARHALKSIEILGREALTEMRRLLGVLWTHDEGSKAPQPRLADLPDLIAQIERAGLPVELRISGQPRTLPAGVELSAYRIVQEALTNTLKHAGPARADVELRYHPELLEVRVDDDGQGSSSLLKAGQGVVSMRQRAALLGGEVSLGPRSGTGFQVAAKLPVNGEP